jgi:hypothetical protein
MTTEKRMTKDLEDDHGTMGGNRMRVLAAAVLVKSGKGRVASVYSREILKTLPAMFSNFKSTMHDTIRQIP